LFSFVGDTVLDPFMGSGTTLAAAAAAGRRAVGIEIEKRYCALARSRLVRALLPAVPGRTPSARARRPGTRQPKASSRRVH